MTNLNYWHNRIKFFPGSFFYGSVFDMKNFVQVFRITLERQQMFLFLFFRRQRV